MKKLFAILLSFQLILAPIPALAGDEPTKTEEQAAAEAQVKARTEVGFGGYAYWANQVLGLVTGAVGGAIIQKFPQAAAQPSVIVYFINSLGYIALEIWAAAEHKSAHNQSVEDLQIISDEKLQAKFQDGGFQLKTLKNAKDSMEANKKFMEARTAAYTVLAVGYGVATGLAIWETACRYNPYCNKDDTIGSPAGSGGGEKNIGLMFASLGWNVATNLPGMVGGEGNGVNGTASTIVSITKTVVGLACTIFDQATAALLQNGPARIATFGATAVLSTTVAVGTGANSGEVAKNVQKLGTAVEYVERNFGANDGISVTPGPDPSLGGLTTSGGSSSGTGGGAQGSITSSKMTNNMASARRCLSKKSDGSLSSSTDCSNPIKMNVSTKDLVGVHPLYLDAVKETQNWANAATSGNRAEVTRAGNALLAMAPRIKKLNEEGIQQLNKILSEKNKRPVDLNKDIANRVKEMQGMVDQAVKQNGGTPGSWQNTAPEVATKEKSTVKSEAAKTPETITVAPAEEFSELEDPMEETNAEVAQALSGPQGFDQFESTVQDVSKRPEVSIFKQLSNRYILNYKRVLEENKTPADGSGPNKK